MLVLRRVLVVLLLASCAPPRSVDRAVLEVDARPDRPASRDRDEPSGEDAAMPDLPPAADGPSPDAGVDAAQPMDASSPDTAVDQGPPRRALLVVGNKGAPTTGDQRIQQVITGRGMTVTLASDEDAADVNGVDLVVLAESSAAAALGDKYRDLTVPAVVLERAVFFSMGMTGSTTIDQGVVAMGTQVTIAMEGHAMAAGLSGTVAVVGAPANIGWGRPEAAAERVATVPGNANQVVVFGYLRGSTMFVGQAPARRVGCFVMDSAAAVLNDNGARLLGAALDWALQ